MSSLFLCVVLSLYSFILLVDVIDSWWKMEYPDYLVKLAFSVTLLVGAYVAYQIPIGG